MQPKILHADSSQPGEALPGLRNRNSIHDCSCHRISRLLKDASEEQYNWVVATYKICGIWFV